MKNLFLYLYIILFFSPIHLNAKIIYCYKVHSNTVKQNLFNFHNNLNYSEEIKIFEIDDKKKELFHIKTYRYESTPVLPETKGHFQNSFYYKDIDISKFGYKKREVEKYKFKDFLKFDENEIISINNYTGKDGKKKRSYFELDRVTGILISTFGITLNESGEEYVENDNKIYIRGDLYFDYHVFSIKSICENHKGI